eukprot:gene13720-biopygen6975
MQSWQLESFVPVRSVASVAPVGLVGAVQPRALGVLVRPVAPAQPVRPVEPAEGVEAVQLNWPVLRNSKPGSAGFGGWTAQKSDLNGYIEA